MGHEVITNLLRSRDGVYVDGTLGGGGHAKLFLQQLSSSSVYIGIDRDQEALDYASQILSGYSNVSYYKGLFSEIGAALNRMGMSNADAILLDLGVSSNQIDKSERGFAFRPGLQLDMRMNREDNMTAAIILSEYSEEQLTTIFFEYGEERFSRRIARNIVRSREKNPITRSEHLLQIIDRSVTRNFRIKSYARIFQALRIEVNRELVLLKQALEQALVHLNPGGRMGIISYHSLEDRMVKQFFAAQENPCVCPPGLPECVCGRKPAIKRIKPYFMTAGEEEVRENPRARSAKFRVGEKI
jgi:16S rRNA (cytosine1402-N4)-methyltransferase